MAKKHVAPSVAETAFSCPHCGAFATQFWHTLDSDRRKDSDRTPRFPSEDWIPELESNPELDADRKRAVADWVRKSAAGFVFADADQGRHYVQYDISNLNLSECFNCRKFAVWVHKSVVHPPQRGGPDPCPDLPEELQRDFEESRTILDLSPRGAAALMRLVIQKLCCHLGEKGRNIDDDIASLVKKGLNPLVQRSLDIVRVVGNEAVHPGTLDLTDDRNTALQLLGLVNAIAEQMISHPKVVKEMYDALPSAKLEAIQRRDGPLIPGSNG
jgi:hypothetical protein